VNICKWRICKGDNKIFSKFWLLSVVQNVCVCVCEVFFAQNAYGPIPIAWNYCTLQAWMWKLQTDTLYAVALSLSDYFLFGNVVATFGTPVWILDAVNKVVTTCYWTQAIIALQMSICLSDVRCALISALVTLNRAQIEICWFVVSVAHTGNC
jgi:hypothetical protein